MKNISIKKKIITGLVTFFTFALVLSSVFELFSIVTKEEEVNFADEYTSVLEINGDELAVFAAQYDDVEKLIGAEAISHNAKVDDIILNTDLSEDMKRQYLEKLGVYEVYHEDKVEFSSSSSDVSLNKPLIYYDSSTKEYVISARGNWKKHTYEVPKFSWWYPSVGSTKNIGGTEAIGISLTNTKGETDGLAINAGYGYFYNGSSEKK